MDLEMAPSCVDRITINIIKRSLCGAIQVKELTKQKYFFISKIGFIFTNRLFP